MTKRRIKSLTGLGLLILMSIGLTISTLHSHHELDLNHPADFDTGNCITVDTTVCPICGIFKINIPPVSHPGEFFLYIDQVTVKNDQPASDLLFTVNKGRSPPSLA